MDNPSRLDPLYETIKQAEQELRDVLWAMSSLSETLRGLKFAVETTRHREAARAADEEAQQRRSAAKPN